jgi:hypothetical protein
MRTKFINIKPYVQNCILASGGIQFALIHLPQLLASFKQLKSGRIVSRSHEAHGSAVFEFVIYSQAMNKESNYSYQRFSKELQQINSETIFIRR